MRELEVGVRIDVETGLSFFGTEQVNALIRQGGRVVAVEPDGAIMRKVGADAANVRLTLGGFSLKVRPETADESQPGSAEQTASACQLAGPGVSRRGRCKSGLVNSRGTTFAKRKCLCRRLTKVTEP